ncbi:MAG: serine hydrolase [Bacteroidales bacterium]
MKKNRIIILILPLILTLNSCHVARYFYWNLADFDDYKKFPAETINKGDTAFHFIPSDSFISLNLPEGFCEGGFENSFIDFLENTKTVALLIIKNDTLQFEHYSKGFQADAMVSSFSVSKSFVSALVGIIIEEGYIKSVHQSVTGFIPELLNSDIRFSKITLEHLLNMQSGIRFNEGYSTPFSDMAKYYYGKNLKKYVGRLKIKSAPGLEYDYVSVNSLLLGIVLERVTGGNLAELIEQRLWRPLGMEYDATWSLDSKKRGQIKAFCCLNSRALDMAKFGRLYLNRGNWNGLQVVPKRWIEATMKADGNFCDSQGIPYSYGWRVKEDGAFFAKGILGQYIYVFPDKEVIIVRLGKRSSGVDWVSFFEKLCSQL